jgi:lysophospholipase L1-like esterase
MEWINAIDPRFTVSGLPWHAENGGTFARLPLRADGEVRSEIRGLGRKLSGGRIRFRSDTAELHVRVAHSADPGMWNMHRVGNSGLDLYVDGRIWGTTYWQNPEPSYEFTFFSGQPRVEREFTLYLPLYNDLTRLEIGLSDGSSVLPPTPFALAKPGVFYGSSITQGGCASRPGNTYPAILSRRLNLDIVNLGFSGNGLGEPEVANLLAEIDAACYVLDFHINVESAEQLRQVYLPFYETLRRRHPEVPILMLSQIFTTREHHEAIWLRKRLEQTAVIREAFTEALRRGDRHVHFCDGTWLIGPEADGAYVDGVHPNDRGFFMMADGLEPVLRDLLLTPPQR